MTEGSKIFQLTFFFQSTDLETHWNFNARSSFTSIRRAIMSHPFSQSASKMESLRVLGSFKNLAKRNPVKMTTFNTLPVLPTTSVIQSCILNPKGMHKQFVFHMCFCLSRKNRNHLCSRNEISWGFCNRLNFPPQLLIVTFQLTSLLAMNLKT